MHRRMLAAVAAVVAASGAHALEPFRLYDTFNAPSVDGARWTSLERSLAVRGGALHLLQRTGGPTGSDAGLGPVNWNANLANPQAVTALRAKVTVNAIEANTCAANPAVAHSRARIIGSFFNTGTPTPGSQVGDAIAQVRVSRFSNDPAGVLRVQGLLNVCTSADCNAAALVGNVVDLGTVALGQSTTVQLQWDRGGKTFLFSRDGGAATGSVAYAHSDTAAPGVAFKQMSTRVEIPACASAPQTTALVDATFDNVAVNASAAP